MTILLAVIIGGLFGFVLQRIGAADSDEIIDMLRLKKMKVAKSIMLGIGVGSAVLFICLSGGQILVSHLSIKAVYWGVPIGGLLLGIGWAVSGFCLGTALSALTTGRKDSAYFVLGGLVGAAIFTALYENLLSTWLFTELLGGKITLADTGSYDAMIEGNGVLVATFISVVFILAAMFMPQKIRS